MNNPLFFVVALFSALLLTGPGFAQTEAPPATDVTNAPAAAEAPATDEVKAPAAEKVEAPATEKPETAAPAPVETPAPVKVETNAPAQAEAPVPVTAETNAPAKVETPAPVKVEAPVVTARPLEPVPELTAKTWTDIVNLTVGTRAMHLELQSETKGKPHENSFIGSIYKLEANQDYTPLHPYAQLTVLLYSLELGVGISRDELSVATVDYGTGDGDIEMEGTLLYLLAAYRNRTRFTPFVEIGQASYKNEFDPIPSWSAGGRREFDLEDSTADYLAGGCDIAIAKGFSANLYVRHVDVDVDGRYIFRGDSRKPAPFTFTLEHIAYALGIAYTF